MKPTRFVIECTDLFAVLGIVELDDPEKPTTHVFEGGFFDHEGHYVIALEHVLEYLKRYLDD